MKYLLVLLVVILCGCDARVLSPDSTKRIATDIANVKAMHHSTVPQGDRVREGTLLLLNDMATAMSIDLKDLPSYETISTAEWKADPETSYEKVQEHISKPVTVSSGWMALIGGGASAILIAILRMFASSLASTPYGMLIGMVLNIMGLDDNPKDKAINSKVSSVIDKVREIEPNNKVLVELSETMTRSEKDHIRDRRSRRKHGR